MVRMDAVQNADKDSWSTKRVSNIQKSEDFGTGKIAGDGTETRESLPRHYNATTEKTFVTIMESKCKEIKMLTSLES